MKQYRKCVFGNFMLLDDFLGSSCYNIINKLSDNE